jgi:hypothetical protein
MEKILTCIKKHCFTIALLLCTKATITSAFAQADSIGINYQAIARDTTGQPFSDTTINVKFSIWDAISNGNMNYSEEHFNVQTNKYGLFTLVIGNGTNATSDFEDITWATTNKYLQVEIDLIPNGYIQMPGRTRFQGVPYARASYIAVTALDGWKTTGNNNLQPNAFLGTTSNDSLIIKTNSNNSIVIDQSGNVEITRGNILIKNSTAAANEIEFNGTAPADIVSNSILNIGTSTLSPIEFKIDNNSKVVIDTIGRVGIGIGTQPPTAKLDVAGTVRIADGTEGLGKILTSNATGLASWQTLSSGTVTQITADSLLPLFTTQVVDSSTTPHIEFTLENASPYTVFGNGTNSATQPSYFKPILNSQLYENQGTANTVLHGNGAGNPSWGQIVNADIATGAVDLTTQVNGTLPIINGGTNATALGDAGSVAYSNGTAYNFTQVGNSGQVLESTGSGAPVWSKRVLHIAGDSIIDATNIDTTNYILSVAMNSANRSGAVLKGDGYSNMVWKTDASGNPAWRTDSSGVSYVMGTGLTLFGNMINSTWTQSVNNIYNNNTANVGIGTNTPANKLDVEGGVAIGATYSGLSAAPTNGAIIEGNVGIGTTTPVNKLDVEGGVAIGATYSGLSTAPSNGAIIQGKVGIGTIAPGAQLHVVGANTTESAGFFENTLTTSTENTIKATSNSNNIAATMFTTRTGNGGGALLASISNAGNNANTIESTTTGTGRAGLFTIFNTASTAEAFSVSSNGLGKGGVFKLSNASNGSEALSAETNGTGRAAYFLNTNAANTSDLVYITTNGGGSKGLSVLNTGQGSSVSNYAGYFETSGTGTGNSNIAGYFSATGASNNYAGIFANGNVGIGTATPTSPLHVKYNSNSITDYGITLSNNNNGTTAFTSILLVNDANVTGGISLNSSGNTTASGASGMNIGTNAATKLQLATNNLPRLTVDATGNVGIGTIIPSSLLHVNGTIRMGSSIANGSLIFNNTTNTTQTVTIQTGATSASYTLTLPTAAPATNNQILTSTTGGVMSWSSASSLGAWTTTGNGGINPATNFIGTTTLVDFVARTNNLERLRITSGGNVGIGTNSPVNMLDVEGKVAIGAAYSGSSAAPENGLIVQGNVGLGITTAANKLDVAGGVAIGTNFVTGGANQAPANGAMIEGNVRIGTTDLLSTAKLHIVNNVPYANELKIENPNTGAVASSMVSLYNNTGNSAFINFGSSNNTTLAGNNGLAIGTVPAGKVQFYTTDTARVTITAAGNVGIGTETPANKLHIFGGSTVLDPNSATTSALILKGGQSAINHVASDGTLKWYSGLKSDNGGATDNYVIMNATNDVPFVLTQTGNVGIGTATPTTNTRLAIKDGHLQSQQTTAPVFTSVTVGYSAVLSNSTDVAGNITITTDPTIAGVVTFTFNKAYSVPPIVVITPTNATAANDKAWITSTTSSFSVNFSPNFIPGNRTYSYHVIETQ